MAEFKKVRSFFVLRITVLAILGVFCQILLTFGHYTIIKDLPNLWEVLIGALGTLFIFGAGSYLTRYRTIGKVDEYLMGEIDIACNELIKSDDPKKLDPIRDECPYIPKLLVKKVHEFGIKILETFHKKKVFQLVEGGVFSVKDSLLPIHPRAIHPPDIEINNELFEFIDKYMASNQGNIAILISDQSKRITDIVDVDNKILKLTDPTLLHDISNKVVPLPFEKAILTPITFDGINIGYLLLFYHSQPFLSRLFNPKEMIDNYMLKKIEDWKLDDAVKSIINKERLLLAFYLEKCIDEITNKAMRMDTTNKKVYEENFPKLWKEIMETICNIMKIDRGSVLCDSITGKIIKYNVDFEENDLKREIFPVLLPAIAADNQKVDIITENNLEGIGHKYSFNNVLYVKIAHGGEDFGMLYLFATRKFEDFDKMIMDIIEDIKLDDLFMLFHK